MRKRSKINLSNYRLLSGNLGSLLPIGVREVLPGDTFQHSTSALVRFSPLVKPVMHPVHATIHHWFVPNRIIWDGWEDFITGGPDNDDPETFPTISLSAVESSIGTLADYLGIPEAEAAETISVSALPFRAYAMIFNEFYRDQDLQTELALSTASGVDATTSKILQQANWGKDYLTTARPWPQKGADVTIPMATTAPVNRVTNATAWKAYRAGTNTLAASEGDATLGGSGQLRSSGGGNDLSLDPDGQLQAALSSVPGSLLELRARFALLRASEARAMYGSRFTEYLAYLGVRSSDARLQRPEYLGGGKQTIQFSEVVSTAATTDADLGALGGHGIGATRSNRYRRFFEEHGFVISLMAVRPIPVYGNGLEPHWNKRTKEQFWQPEYEHIGMEAVPNKVVYARHDDPDGDFGYVPRYEDYRMALSGVSGNFRTNEADWHLARLFTDAAEPSLNSSFVQCVPSERIFADSNPDHMQIMVSHYISARRLVKKNPGSFVL